MKASEVQIGGKHYKDYPIQPAEFCQRNKLNWCESNVVKLVTRHRDKGGVQDIDKAIHYLQLLKEWEYLQPEPHTPTEVRPGRRGEKEVYAFAEAMIETLNLPKNAQKDNWKGLSLLELIHGTRKEFEELESEIYVDRHHQVLGTRSYDIDPDRVKAEATDLANFAMFIHDYFNR